MRSAASTLLAALLGCWLNCAAATHDADLDQIMKALAQRQQGHASFTERKYLALLDRPVESSGELLYEAPDHLEKRTLRPKPESLILSGGVITVQRGHSKRVLQLQQYPQVLPFIESIRATLAGDTAALRRVFKLELSGGFEHWSLDLVPLDPKLAQSVTHIRIEGERALIHTVTIEQADGDHSVLTIGPELTP